MKIFFKNKTEKKLSMDYIKGTSKTEKYCRLVKTWSKQNKVLFIILYNKKEHTKINSKMDDNEKK